KSMEMIEQKLTLLSEPDAKIQRWIGSLNNLQKIIDSSKKLKEYEFYLKDLAQKSKYILSDKEEAAISKMKNTGSKAWEKLRDLLVSNLLVDIKKNNKLEKLPLTIIRNMAYKKDSGIRKKAYEAELKAYEKIDDSIAACLSGIKGEVITTTAMRGYKSVVSRTLIDSRMDEETLDVMLTAIKESLPVFRKYYRKKAEILGNKNGLPFYDLFAPLGEANMVFTYEEAQKFIVNNFRTFSDNLADFALNAFNKRWIDVEPREGKVGGAFCENIHAISESRIMTNFSGSFNDVVTIAHELGHGYHGDCLKKETMLNSDYPMPIAETASTFCETIIKKAAIKDASKENAFAILETEISDCGQVIVDIYSRFLFEQEVFKRRETGSLNKNELKEIMINAQKEAYGDGLDPNYLHPYMWLCKPHYYYADYNFYNFPYAFGLLFSKGLYAEYEKRGANFVKEYDKLLSITGKNKISDVTKFMNIDINNIEFWRSSLKIVEKDIEDFCSI
ncbi:MAG: M3 family oligoendopeptidase, partial [Bacillota bacterium]|nr:M3 family oligoendopeptidase [Bacillota bacterium]